MADLDPCPFCKGEHTHIGDDGDTHSLFVQCDDCGARGPTGTTPADATRRWEGPPQPMPAIMVSEDAMVFLIQAGLALAAMLGVAALLGAAGLLGVPRG